jgi:pyruvate/2-oxoglutarate/acetoin dehydrogenase E1 component/TPP-dependent pyruvate/acetoin dehydrogenase alpha subunit
LEKTITSRDLLATTPPSDEEILHDYYICCLSRELSTQIRREALTGKAKFGVSDDGKELFQVAMAKVFDRGDFRSDYYRGHTLLLALNLCTVEDLFAQLYADCDNDPLSGGRQMNNHHATPLIDSNGDWLNHLESYNLSSDISTTAGQMARGVGLAFASKKYRTAQQLEQTKFSDNGNEVCFCNIGDGSTSEGAFWESVNASGVLQIPLAITVVDDGYGISVPTQLQTTKASISKVLAGFKEEIGGDGIDIYQCKGWDYPALVATYQKGIEKVRLTHTPALFHIEELTQPQGHSTSGSHERYKDKARMKFEQQYDCNRQFKLWIIANDLADEEELKLIETRARKEVREAKKNAWKRYYLPIELKWREVIGVYEQIAVQFPTNLKVQQCLVELKELVTPVRSEIYANVRRVLAALRNENSAEIEWLKRFLEEVKDIMQKRYHTHLYSETPKSALQVPVIEPTYTEEAPVLNGYEIINRYFDLAFAQQPNLYAFGEDLGKIGGVNQGMAGLQAKYGEDRIFDVGIREWTIVGQALGMAMRGLRPIAEIQYLDYLIYGFSPLSDDVATLRYRSNNQQAAPVIIRTRGHRLEGIWHSGSPMSVLLGGLRGMYVLVPRNFVQAAGMYQTLLQSDDPAVLIECLNGYRHKERLPENLGTYTVPLGVPDFLRTGSDVSLITYGACVRIAEKACDLLAADGISVDLIDVQTLLPFDLEHRILGSLKKTNRIVFLDEDVPGGGTAYMLDQVLVKQGGYRYLDSAPLSISARAHRPPYGTDGDYFSKPNPEDVYEAIYSLMTEAEPHRF